MADGFPQVPEPATAGFSVDWLTPIRGHRTFELIIEQLEAALLSGQLYAGARLPPERELAAALDVSRPSVREAIRVLEALGLVDVQRGPNGVKLRREPGDGFASILRLHLALGHYTRRSTVELRCVLEAWSFAEAAQSREPEMLERLKGLVKHMAKPNLTPIEFNELDIAFHATVIDSRENELAAMVLRGLRSVVRRQMYDGLLGVGEWSETSQTLLAEHRELYELIRAGEAEAVERKVRDHIQTWATHALISAMERDEIDGSPAAEGAAPGTATPTAPSPWASRN